MSLNGDIMVMRNGRSTSTVSIYNYPEHLNPFYEDDQHKRLRFWHVNKKGDGDRRNSFSLGGIKDMWAFKSFRSKKKSSTLGINKTSESPPPLRREYQIDAGNLFNSYDRRARYSSNGVAGNGSSNNFERNATYRSSLQNMNSTLDSPTNGFGLNRNDQYRSTIQFGGRSNQDSKTASRPVPQPRRYVYGGSVTPQPSRNSEFSRGLTRNSGTQGSSQHSISTNPFDSDDEEENEQQIANAGSATNLAGKRTPRKKRRAPAPPAPIHSTNSTEISSQMKNSNQTELRIEENLDIANLTAEIESFVKTTNDEASENQIKKAAAISDAQTKNEKPKTNGTIPKEKIIPRTSVNMVITRQFIPQPKPSNTNLCITEDDLTETKPALPEKKKINQHIVAIRKEGPSLEVGNVECIHVHVESPRSTPERTVPRVTSFKKETTPPTERITSKTSFTLASPPTSRRENNENIASTQKVTVTEKTNSTSNEIKPQNLKENGVVTEAAITKPPISTKPNVESIKPKVPQNFAVIHKPSRRVVLSSETEEIAEPAQTTINEVAITTKQQPTARTTTNENKLQTRSEIAESSGLNPSKPNTSERHVMFLPDERIKNVASVTENEKVEITKKPEAKEVADAFVALPDIKVVEKQTVSQATTTSTLNYTPITKPCENTLRIEEANPCSPATPNAKHVSPRDEFEALYRNRPASHLEWKQSTLAPLESHVPPEKRRSVKDIIESINRSQRLLQAAANKDLPLLSTTSQMPPPSYNEVVNQTNVNGHKDNDLDQSLKSLDETQREIERMFKDIIAEDASDEAPSPSGLGGSDDLQKPNNEEVFQKCKVTKEVYDYRETSPTTSNLDWNPVPKPKRSKNLSEQREH